MPIYNYKALKEDGGHEIGVIDADSPKDARLKLRAKKIFVSELSQVGEKGRASKVRLSLPFLRKKKTQEIAIITGQISTLLSSGIPLMGALTAVIEQAEDRHLKAVLMDVRERVAQGNTLADALAANPFYFSELYVNMVRAGEASGTLDKVLKRIADYLQAQSRVRAKVVAALTYPIIMMIIGTCVVIFLLTFVVPKIVEIIQKQQKALPLPTEILITVSGFLKNFWWVLLVIAIIIYLLYKAFVKTEKGKLMVDTLILDLPVLGQLFKKQAISRFSITFATLLESGLPILDALAIVKRVVNNQLLANTIEQIRQRIAEGADIATPLKRSKIFPPVVGYMIAIGEESGKLEELLRKISEVYDEEIEIASQKLTALLEPLMIVVMAFIVGFIVLSILLPILQMARV